MSLPSKTQAGTEETKSEPGMRFPPVQLKAGKPLAIAAQDLPPGNSRTRGKSVRAPWLHHWVW